MLTSVFTHCEHSINIINYLVLLIILILHNITVTVLLCYNYASQAQLQGSSHLFFLCSWRTSGVYFFIFLFSLLFLQFLQFLQPDVTK